MTAAAGLIAGFVLPLLGLAATAWVLGRGATRALGLGFSGRLEKGAVSTVLGLALASYLLLLLGLCGRLQVVPVLLAAALVHVFGAPVWRETWDDLRDLRAGGFRPAWMAVLFLAVLPFALPALYPPTAFDATLYHLPFARAFVETGGLPYLADRRFPVFPQANEVLFAAVMLFGRDVAAQGVQLLATLLTAALLAVWARRAFPDFRAAGALAAAIFLGNPLVSYLAGTAYIEPGLTLFVTGGLFAVDRWRETGDRRWLVPAAALAATAADVKYLGLYFLGAAALLVALTGKKPRPLRERGLDVLRFGGVALVFLAPWYLRLVILTGNPVFPYAPQLFGANPWQPLPDPNRTGTLAQRLLRAVRIPWDLVFARQAYGGLPPASPFYLAAIPVIVAGAVRDARLRRWLAVWLPVVAVYALACSWLPRDSRYLVPVFPLAGLAVVGSVAACAGRWRSSRAFAWGLCLLCLGCLAPGWLYGCFWMARNGPVPLTPAGREAFLANRVPGYAAVSWLNRTRGRAYTVWALHVEQATYFADGRFLGDWAGPASYGRVLAASPSPEALHRELRRLGADHLLLPTAFAKDRPFSEDAELRRWFEPVYQDADARVYVLRPAPTRAAGSPSSGR
ncbi:MAG: glycosyltransferase family 39 protein [Thermoanaerobaculia bacterium]